MNKRLLFAVLLITICCFGFLPSAVKAQIKNPEITRREIKFVYINPFARSVYLKTSIDNWEKRYPLKKSRKEPWDGAWVLTFDIENPLYGARFQLKKGTYQYKLLVDGHYIYDDKASKTIVNKNGEKISAFTLDEDLYSAVKSPIHIKNAKGLYRFFYWNFEAKSVYVAGTFNNFNPYSHPLKKTKEGYWEIELQLLPGKYYYQFIVDSSWTKDPMNPEYEKGIHPEPSSTYSHLVVKE